MIRTDLTYEEALALPDPKRITLGPNTVTVDTDPPKEVPEHVSNYQARLALDAAGLLSSVDALIQSASNDLKIRFEFSEPWYRNSKHVKQVATALGWTDEQLDDLFIAATKL